MQDAQDAEAAAVYGQQEIHQKIMQVVATSTTSGNSCERINFQLNFRDCHAKIRQVDSHETLANGVVVQVLSLDLHITFLTTFLLFSFISQTR